MTYRTARIKQTIEQIGIFPFVLLGRLIGLFYRMPNPGGYFLIYPNRDTGGSYKVNADIAELISDKKPLLIFTKHERNGGFRHLFEIEDVKILDISKQIDNKAYHFINLIWRGIIASWVNRCERPVMLGGETIYFYKLLPHVKKETHCVELCHVNKWINYTQAFIPFIDVRLFSTQKIKRDVEKQYQQNEVPATYHDRLLFIDNKIDIPPAYDPANEHLKVLFVGRGSPQKRVHLVAKIAEAVIKDHPHITFTLVGDVTELIPAHVKPLLTIRTDINKAEQLQPLYRSHDVLILTSLFEGLPIVVMDMMAQGRVVLSTAVDGIPDYIHDMENGLLIHEVKNEQKVVEEGVRLIVMLDNDKALLQKLSTNARAFALAHFSSQVFDESYKKVLHYEQ
jgi:glycosyltransferase involved in cell wall biosynthesis